MVSEAQKKTMKQSDPLLCFCAAASGLGCSASDLGDALVPFGRIAAEAVSEEEMVLLIKQNPSLSFFEKHKLIKRLRR